MQSSFNGVEGIAKSLGTDLKSGIEGTPRDLEQRIQRYGSNKTKDRKVKTLFELGMECFEDTILQILIGAAIVSLVVGVIQHGFAGLIEGASILISISIIVVVTAGNNWVKERQFQELQRKSDISTAIVIRNGTTRTMSSEDLCVGDLVVIENGKQVPADCVLVNSTDLSINESNLTGEAEAMNKQHVTAENYQTNPQPFIMSSSLVESGEARAIVCAVGEHTQAGKAERTLDI